MEILIKILSYLRELPDWSKVLSVIIITLISIILIFNSCSVTQTTTVGDHNSTSAGSTTTVQIDSTCMTPSINF